MAPTARLIVHQNSKLLAVMTKHLSAASMSVITLLFITLIICVNQDGYKCETKDFDWGDLGVSLASNKSPYNGASNNLRILVSPQRRMTKSSYEYDYGNSSQPITSNGETSYIIPGTSSPYVAQPSSQLGHSAAYSALTASLTSLKNRLNARGVSLSSSLGDGSSQTGLYQNPSASPYSSTLLTDSQSQTSGHQMNAQTQPTYLSVTNQQVDQQSSGGYTNAQGQGNDNKTIVLAIPAKINFLTDGRTSSAKHQPQQQQQQQQQQQTHNQQLAVIQTTGSEQQARPDYSASKQMGLINGQDNSADPAGHIVSRDASGGSPDQDGQQYVLVNSSPSASGENQQLMTGSGLQPQPYSSLYQTGPSGAYSMKYLPTYQTTIQQPTVPKIYSTGETGIGYSEAQIDEQYGRYGGCIDTCNSADVRWRKYSVSKYKYCCSRSNQYDPQFEQPSAEKLSENSKQADDAFYNYMYRRMRSRRSRKSANRHNSRHYKQIMPSALSHPSEESPVGEMGLTQPDIGNGRTGRYQGPSHDSPYMRYHKTRSHGSADLHDSISTGTSGNKYMSKERSYRRGRSRDYDPIDPSHQSYDSQDEESSYHSEQGTRGSPPAYGGGDESVGVGTGSRYASDGQSIDEDDVHSSSSPYDEQSESETERSVSMSESSDYPDDGVSAEKPVVSDDGEQEVNSGHKYTTIRRKKQAAKASRLRKGSNGKYRKARKNKPIKQTPAEHQSSGQVNGTEYETSGGNDQYHQEPTSTSNSGDDDKQHNSKETTANSDQADKEAVNYSNKMKSLGLNESTVVNLSKTTMHLKEILLMLEKKAHLKVNESTPSNGPTTPSPLTTTSTVTNFYPLASLGSQYANSASLQLQPSDYLATELSLKSPYRFESSPSLSSGLTLPSQAYPTMNMDSYSSLASPYGPANQFSGLSSKHLNYAAVVAAANGHHPRKRRTNKHVRYNHLLMSKPHGLGSASSLLQHSAFSKNPILGSSYYSSLQYPYPYSTRGNYQTTFTSYPYKNINKNTYPSSLNSPVVPKLSTTSAGLYSDESRLHGMSNLDPLANVASSLRPSTTMRLRSKPFLFQPHVLPIYTRHSILTQPVDKK